MSALRNPKHELFAQGLAQGMTATGAIVYAKYADNGRNADRLKKNEEIASRVRELQAESQERHNVSVDSLTQMYRDALKEAREDKAHPAIMAGINNLAKLHGLIIDKARVEQGRLDEMSDDAIADDIEKRLARIAAGRTEGTGETGDGAGQAPEPKPDRKLQPVSEATRVSRERQDG